MGTYGPAMSEWTTYLGLLMILVVVYMLEKLTILVTGQLYALKYNKEKLQAHLANKHKIVNHERGSAGLNSNNTTGLNNHGMHFNINNSGGSDESAKEQFAPEQMVRARSSSVQSRDQVYTGYAYNEENISALAKAVRRSTKKLIAEGRV